MEHVPCEMLLRKAFPFWDRLDAAQQDSLCRNTQFKTYRRGEHVHGGNGECTGAILVKSGCLRAYLLSESGKEVTLYRLYEGDVCMLSASCVLQSITFDVFVDAAEDSECYILNGRTFAQISENNLYAENFALNTAVSRFSDAMWAMQQILFMSFDQRLAVFLWDESQKTGEALIRLTQDSLSI